MKRLRPWALVLFLPLVTGCGTLDYYVQAVRGQLDLMRRATPIAVELTRTDLPDDIKRKLRVVQGIREFASRELGLPDNGSYRSYVELARPFVLWNVFVAPEFSLDLVTSCFPVAGCVGYRGYFQEADAQAEAAARRAHGYDVHVGGVPAYSTLGWFDDPVLSSFVRLPDAELARLVFHELAHQLLYVKDDTAFNESFATAVERSGVARWLAQPGHEYAQAEYEQLQQRKQAFLALLLRYQVLLKEYYAQGLPTEVMRSGKLQRFTALLAEYRELKVSWGGYPGYDAWFGRQPNNATLASVALYTEFVPGFEALLGREGGDLGRFYAEAKALARLDRDQRHARLRSLAAP